jgi:hypothetical protein
MNANSKIAAALLAASLLFGVGGSANAVVSLQEDGSWFVGKGDVQSAFGWDAKTSDTNFEKVTFKYKSVTEETVECVTKDRGSVTLHGTTASTSATERATVYEVRRSGKNSSQVVTGAFVKLSGTPSTVGSSPDCSTVGGVVDNSTKITVRTRTLLAEIEQSIKGKKNVVSAVIWEEIK